MAVAGSVVIDIAAKHAAFSSAVKSVQKDLHGLAATANGIKGQIAGAFAGVAAFVAGKALVGGAQDLVTHSLELAAPAEQAKVAFTVMLGSAEKAQELQDEINQFAAATPFQTTELIGASKSLLAFGVSSEQVIPTMRTLGDLAAGLNIPIGELAELYGKAKVQGRLMAQDVNQLVGRGIPVIQEFAKQFKVGEGEVKALVESGKIGFPQLQTALVNLTSNGGKFAGLMEAQSHTLAGMWSTLADSIDLNLTKIGAGIAEKLDLKGAMDGVSVAINVLADAAIPVLMELLGTFAEVGVTGSAAGDTIISATQGVATGFAHVANVIDSVQIIIKGLQVGMSYLVEGFAIAFKSIGNFVKDLVNGAIGYVNDLIDLLNTLPGINVEKVNVRIVADDAAYNGFIAGLHEQREELKGEIGELSKMDRVERVGEAFAAIRDTAFAATVSVTNLATESADALLKIEADADGTAAAVAKVMDKLKDDVADFGLTDVEKQIRDLKDAGASPEDVKAVEDMAAQLSGLEQQKKLLEDANKLWEANLTPVEKYRKAIDDLNANPFIDDETWASEVGKLQDELRKSAGKDETTRKAQAVSRRIDFYVPGEKQRKDPLLDILGTNKQAVAEQKKTNEKLGKLVTNLAGAADDEWDF